MSEYVPYKATLDDGREVLVQLYIDLLDGVEMVQLAFRDQQQRTWSPPIDCERA